MIWAVGIALSFVVVVLAWRVARHRPEHRAVAWFLSANLAADVARQAIALYVLAPARARLAGAPFTGLPRAAFHVEEAGFLLWPAGVAALSIVVFLRRRAWPVVIVYGLAVLALAATYPVTRGPTLRRAYLGLELAALAVALGCFVMWVWRKEAATLTRATVLLLAVVELIIVAGPYASGLFASWGIAQAVYATLYVVLVLLHGVGSWGSSKPSS